MTCHLTHTLRLGPFRLLSFIGNSNGGVQKVGSRNSRAVLQTEVAIGSEVSNSSKHSLAITHFLTNENAASKLLRKPPSCNPRPMLANGPNAVSGRLVYFCCCHLISGCCLKQDCRWRPYRVEYTRSLPNSEVKQPRAWLVLWWGTAREDQGARFQTSIAARGAERKGRNPTEVSRGSGAA